jgi:hypothetical protein
MSERDRAIDRARYARDALLRAIDELAPDVRHDEVRHWAEMLFNACALALHDQRDPAPSRGRP